MFGIVKSKNFLCPPGQPCVIGSILPIFAAPGDDIILPCHLEPPLNVEGQTIEWSRPDLQPDPSDRLSHVEYVHVYRHRHEVRDIKIQSYVGRTLLFEKELKHGNISLMITNVTVEDEGKYKCYIPKLKSQVKEAFVRLFVGECWDVQNSDFELIFLEGSLDVLFQNQTL